MLSGRGLRVARMLTRQQARSGGYSWSGAKAEASGFGIVFDVDGVLVKGAELVPAARSVLSTLHKHK